jgi:hypothetical protein
MQTTFAKTLAAAGMAWCAAVAGSAWAADDDADALQLEGAAPVATAPTQDADGRRVFVEAAVGRAQRRYGLDAQSLRRVSIDANWRWRLGDAWQLVVSDRLDDVHPTAPGTPSTINTFREGYASWSAAGGQTVVDLGRVNVRLGPAYGWNPTDFFRDGAVRSATSEDPFALRENRQGTVMLRGQRVWNGGAASLAFAPKLADRPSRSGFAADFGATNAAHKLLGTWSITASDRLSGQLLAYAERGRGGQVGASATALLSDALVAHGEWSYGRDALLLSRVVATQPEFDKRGRAAAGLTWTLPTRLALTVEYEYNGFAPTADERSAIADLDTQGLLLADAQRRQELASRRAWLLYATQQNLGMKGLDGTAFVRLNAQDDSYLAWLELRYHWPRFDVALQWRRSNGDALTEFGLPPQRQAVQLIGALYF